MITFGAGDLFATQKTNAAGQAVANATPVKFGVLQGCSLDFSFEEKLLHGAYAFPVAFGRGKGKISGKADFAEIYGRVYGDLLLGSGTTAAIRALVVDFAATIPGSPHQVTVTPPSSGTFVTDLGVRLSATGLPLMKVASAPTAGQYSVSAGGQYTFASADATAGVLISYEYTAASTTARVSSITNQLMGYAPKFSLAFAQPYAGKIQTVVFTDCYATKLALAPKNDDFTIPGFEFTAIAGADGSLGYIATTE